MSTPDASVVVVTHQSAAIIGRCLSALQDSTRRSLEVIVVDAASSDGSAVHARALGATVIELTDNVGFAAATNVGMRAASGRYLVLLNPDAFVDHGAIDALIERLEARPRIGIAGAVLRYPDGQHQPSAGPFPSLTGNLWIAFGLHRAPIAARTGIGLFAHPALYRVARRVDWVTGALVAARREVGPLPEDTFMYGEDVLWARRAAERGLETWVEPRATAVHALSHSVVVSFGISRKQRARVQFEDLWFVAQGRTTWWASRVVLVVHALVRLAAATGLRAFGGPAEATKPWRALVRAALERPAPHRS